MTRKLTLTLAQLNPTLGDIGGNLDKLRTVRASATSADLIVTPELYVSAYPPEDLVLKPSFLDAIEQAVADLAAETSDGGPAILLGAPWREQGQLYNAALLLDRGVIQAKIFKTDLPNYGPFDEKRVFDSAPLSAPIDFRGARLGILICEDFWTPAAAAHLRDLGAEILISPNGSPFEMDKLEIRLKLARQRVQETGLPFVCLNQIGGQDELVFDGQSFVLDAEGKCLAQLKAFDEETALIYYDFDTKTFSGGIQQQSSDRDGLIYSALVTGLRDYVRKNGFPGVVLGLSGGIDSALVAALAVDALGADRVWTVMMPSPFTSPESLADAAIVARALGCRYDTLSIEPEMRSFAKTLAPVFAGRATDVTEENIQSRCRGLILMAISNKFGPMVVATGNKSEMAAGYATLYGDMCGGFAVLKDVYKTEVFRLSRWRNAHKPALALGPTGIVIPESVLTKPPTAELRHDQKDEDSLPPYGVLDDILRGLIEEEADHATLVARGHDAATVRRVALMLDRSEYKRRQAPPGVKITRRSFGRDRRYPITNRYNEA